jgi:FMNH2-dependent dimethyl sulfone monooxygenase
MDSTPRHHRNSITADVLRGPFDPGGQPSLERDHPLHLSLFAWNVRCGLSATKAVLADPPRYRDFWEWPSASTILREAERAGFDSQLQYGMWSGYGGAIGWNDASLDFATGAAASAAVTERLGLFTTVHVGYGFHPLLIAKITAATDNVSGGRLGVNIVAAADAHDYRQFGFADRRTPEERYAIADEFTTLLKYLWTSEDPIDFDGDYFQAYGAQINPRPTGRPRPLLMNAATSDRGIDYAARQCDAIFVSPYGEEGYRETADKVRAKAASYDRKVRICAMCYVVVEDTDEKAAETVAWLENEADIEAIGNQFWRMQPVYNPGQGDPNDPYLGMGEEFVRRIAAGMGGHHITGSFETVADKLQRLHSAGVEHVALCFFDPLRGVQQFGERVIPLLRERGLRSG